MKQETAHLKGSRLHSRGRNVRQAAAQGIGIIAQQAILVVMLFKQASLLHAEAATARAGSVIVLEQTQLGTCSRQLEVQQNPVQRSEGRCRR